MPKQPRPWFRKGRGWFVCINGQQINLGKDRKVAFRQFHEMMARPPHSPPEQTDLASLLDKFLEWCSNNNAAGTYDWYRTRIQSFLDHVKSISIEELRPFHIDEWLQQHPTWAPGQKRGAITAIQRPLNWAVDMAYIDRSPIGRMKKPPQGKREEVVTAAEFGRIIELTRDQNFKDLALVSYECPSRPEEIFRVERRHLDFGNERWVFPVKESKGKKFPRVVYLSDSAVEICKRLAEQWPVGPIFRNTQDRPWCAYSVSCRFTRLQKKMGKRFCLYNFRHTWATNALQNGVDPLTVSVLLGHADTSMLARVYSHLTYNPDYLRDSARKARAKDA